MSDAGDHGPVMPATPLLDDAAIEAVISGDAAADAPDPLAVFAALVRAEGDGAPPHPSPALAGLLADGLPANDGATSILPAREDADTPPSGRGDAQPARRPASRRRLAARVAGLGLAAKLAIGAAAGAAAALGAGTLPGPAGRAVRDAIQAVTPIDFPGDDHPADDQPGDGRGTGGDADRDPIGEAGEAGEHGDRVPSDATGGSDGEPGVHGQQVAETAPGAAERPGDTPAATADPGTRSSTVPPSAPDRPSNPRAPADPGPPPSVPSTVPAPPTTHKATGGDGTTDGLDETDPATP